MTRTLIALGIVLLITLAIMWFIRRNIVEKIVLKYFSWSEFDSPSLMPTDAGKEVYEKNGKSYLRDSGKDNMQLATVYMLDRARHTVERKWNKSHPEQKIIFSVTSGYRTPHYNATIDGAVDGSSHTNGTGFDISTAGYSIEQKKQILSALVGAGFKRIGIYKTHVHGDNDETKPQDVVWYQDGLTSEEKINPFDLIV